MHLSKSFIVNLLLIVFGFMPVIASNPVFITMNCDNTVNVSALPQILCAPDSVDLIATSEDIPYAINWFPDAQLASPHSLSTKAFVNQTSTFSIEVQTINPLNLITNGNFSQGATSFVSDYTQGSGGSFGLLSNAGTYATTINSSIVHSDFVDCPDHTGAGNMLVVNGDDNSGANVWCQMLSVNPSTDYLFSFWMTSVNGLSPATLEVSFNGVNSGGQVSPPLGTCNWGENTFEWNSGGFSFVDICIVNANTAMTGNDFALDDISLHELCSTVEDVTVEMHNNIALWSALDYCEDDADFNLNTLLSPLSTLGGVWTINGIPSETFSPSTLGAGNFYVSYSVGDQPCIQSHSEYILLHPISNAPNLVCENVTESSVLISWDSVAGVSGYNYEVITGQTGVLSGTSLEFTGLSNNEAVTVAVESLSAFGCGSRADTITCVTTACASAGFQFTYLDTLCYHAAMPNIDLEVTPVSSAGTGVWGGNGIVDITGGEFSPSTAGPGLHYLSYEYFTSECSNIDSMPVVIAESVDGAIQIEMDSICNGGSNNVALISFQGVASPNAQYSWDFDGGIVLGIPEHASGPYEVSWDELGDYEINLRIDDQCGSPLLLRDTVSVFEFIGEINFLCSPSFSSFTVFWDQIPIRSSLVVHVIPIGTITSDTSIMVDELVPGTSVDLTFFYNDPFCNSFISDFNCHSVYCPEIVDVIDPIPDLCPYEEVDTFQITTTIPDSLSESIDIFWEGNGLIDTELGIIQIDTSLIGQQQLIGHFSNADSSCMYSDTIVYQVLRAPDASIDGIDLSCAGDYVDITFAGMASDSSMYTWDFDGGMIVSGEGEGPYVIQWDTPGVKDVSVLVEDSRCGVDSSSFSVEILSAPLLENVNCTTDFTSVLFTWNPVADATSYQVISLESAGDAVPINDTAYMVSNLMPGDQASIEVSITTSNICGNIVDTMTCSADICTDVSIQITDEEDICFETGEMQSIQYEVNVTGDTIGGNFYWSGPGIDPQSGLLQLDQITRDSVIEIIAFFENGPCVYSDTSLINVYLEPTASFTALDQICLSDTLDIVFTGDEGTGSNNWYWELNGGQSTGGMGAGLDGVFWSTSGQYQISLVLESDGCFSDTFYHTVQVDPLIEALMPECNTGNDFVEVVWPALANLDSVSVELTPVFDYEWSSDTSILVTGLMPDTNIDFTLSPHSSNNCPTEPVDISCISSACPDLMLDWSVSESEICEGGSIEIEFDQLGNNVYDITVASSLGDTMVYLGVADGFSIMEMPSDTVIYSILNISNPSLPSCEPEIPQDIMVNVNEAITPSIVLDLPVFCEGDSEVLALSSFIEPFQNGGEWQYTGSVIIPPSAFDGMNGLVNTTTLSAGVYTFSYSLMGASPCPDQILELTLHINALPIADAGQDGSLGCNVDEFLIGGNQSTQFGVTYSWSSQNGSFIPDPTALYNQVMFADTYTLTVVDTTTSCSSTDQIVVADEAFEVNAVVSFTNISCNGGNDGTITVEMVEGGTTPYLYQLNDEPFASQNSFINLAAGVYSITVMDVNGCTYTEEITIQEPQFFQSEILIDGVEYDEYYLPVGDEIGLELYTGIDSVLIDTIIWVPDSLVVVNPYFIIDAPAYSTTYQVFVWDVNGCTSSDIITVYVDKTRHVHIPNAFSPNDDGVNDKFMIMGGKGIKSIKHFQIFNRWGNMVFEQEDVQANDPAYGWDGTFGGKVLNPAVFVYRIEIEFVDGVTDIYSGELVLLR